MEAKTILLVEDNADNRAIYSDLLRYVGYDVVEAGDGDAALDLARAMRPVLILMDISLPRRDGYEVTRLLKGNDMTASIPVVALTAHAMEGDREKAREAGCDGYLAKPIEPRQVVHEVQRIIGDPR